MDDYLNHETLAALRELDEPGKTVFMVKIINAYLSDTEELLKEVRAAHRSGNPALLAKLAHSLKGTSLNVGADGLASLMKMIEREGEKGILCAPDRVTQAEAGFHQVRNALNAYKKSL